MVRLELFSLLEKFGLSAPQAENSPAAPAAGRPQLNRLADGAAMLPRLEDQGSAWFCCQWKKDGTLSALVFAHKEELWVVEPDPAFLRAFFPNPLIRKYTHNVKPLHRLALSLGCRMEAVAMDTALAGYLLAGKAGGANAGLGTGYELEAIAGCTIGGVSTTGGIGTVGGILVGVLVFELLKIVLQFLNVDPNLNYIVQGLVIVVAVALDIRKNLAKK